MLRTLHQLAILLHHPIIFWRALPHQHASKVLQDHHAESDPLASTGTGLKCHHTYISTDTVRNGHPEWGFWMAQLGNLSFPQPCYATTRRVH